MISVRFGPDDVRQLPGAQTFTTGDECALPRITFSSGVPVIECVPAVVADGIPVVLSDAPISNVSALLVNGAQLHNRGLQPICPEGYALMEHEPGADGIRFTAIKLQNT
jgi:hypothetical protein